MPYDFEKPVSVDIEYNDIIKLDFDIDEAKRKIDKFYKYTLSKMGLMTDRFLQKSMDDASDVVRFLNAEIESLAGMGEDELVKIYKNNFLKIFDNIVVDIGDAKIIGYDKIQNILDSGVVIKAIHVSPDLNMGESFFAEDMNGELFPNHESFIKQFFGDSVIEAERIADNITDVTDNIQNAMNAAVNLEERLSNVRKQLQRIKDDVHNPSENIFHSLTYGGHTEESALDTIDAKIIDARNLIYSLSDIESSIPKEFYDWLDEIDSDVYSEKDNILSYFRNYYEEDGGDIGDYGPDEKDINNAQQYAEEIATVRKYLKSLDEVKLDDFGTQKGLREKLDKLSVAAVTVGQMVNSITENGVKIEQDIPELANLVTRYVSQHNDVANQIAAKIIELQNQAAERRSKRNKRHTEKEAVAQERLNKANEEANRIAGEAPEETKQEVTAEVVVETDEQIEHKADEINRQQDKIRDAIDDVNETQTVDVGIGLKPNADENLENQVEQLTLGIEPPAIEAKVELNSDSRNDLMQKYIDIFKQSYQFTENNEKELSDSLSYLFDRIDDAPETNLMDSSIKIDDVVSRIMKLGTTTTRQELRFRQFLEKYGDQKWNVDNDFNSSLTPALKRYITTNKSTFSKNNADLESITDGYNTMFAEFEDLYGDRAETNEQIVASIKNVFANAKRMTSIKSSTSLLDHEDSDSIKHTIADTVSHLVNDYIASKQNEDAPGSLEEAVVAEDILENSISDISSEEIENVEDAVNRVGQSFQNATEEAEKFNQAIENINADQQPESPAQERFERQMKESKDALDDLVEQNQTARKSAENMQKEGNAAEELPKKFEKASKAKGKFSKENKKVSESAQESTHNIDEETAAAKRLSDMDDAAPEDIHQPDRVSVRYDPNGDPFAWTQTKSAKEENAKRYKSTTMYGEYDDDGDPVLTGSVLSFDYAKYIREEKKDKAKVERAQKVLDNYISQLENKTQGMAGKILGYEDYDDESGNHIIGLKNFKINGIEDIEKAINMMKAIDTEYNKITQAFRKGSSSLNPFVNAINGKNGLRSAIDSIGFSLRELGDIPLDIGEKFDEINTLYNNLGNLEEDRVGILEYAESFGNLKVGINDLKNDIAAYKRDIGLIQKQTLFTEKKNTLGIDLDVYEAQVKAAGKMTDSLQVDINDLREALNSVNDAFDMSMWSEAFKQVQKNGKLSAAEMLTAKNEVAEALKLLKKYHDARMLLLKTDEASSLYAVRKNDADVAYVDYWNYVDDNFSRKRRHDFIDPIEARYDEIYKAAQSDIHQADVEKKEKRIAQLYQKRADILSDIQRKQDEITHTDKQYASGLEAQLKLLEVEAESVLKEITGDEYKDVYNEAELDRIVQEKSDETNAELKVKHDNQKKQVDKKHLEEANKLIEKQYKLREEIKNLEYEIAFGDQKKVYENQAKLDQKNVEYYKNEELLKKNAEDDGYSDVFDEKAYNKQIAAVDKNLDAIVGAKLSDKIATDEAADSAKDAKEAAKQWDELTKKLKAYYQVRLLLANTDKDSPFYSIYKQDVEDAKNTYESTARDKVPVGKRVQEEKRYNDLLKAAEKKRENDETDIANKENAEKIKKHVKEVNDLYKVQSQRVEKIIKLQQEIENRNNQNSEGLQDEINILLSDYNEAQDLLESDLYNDVYSEGTYLKIIEKAKRDALVEIKQAAENKTQQEETRAKNAANRRADTEQRKAESWGKNEFASADRKYQKLTGSYDNADLKADGAEIVAYQDAMKEFADYYNNTIKGNANLTDEQKHQFQELRAEVERTSKSVASLVKEEEKLQANAKGSRDVTWDGKDLASLETEMKSFADATTSGEIVSTQFDKATKTLTLSVRNAEGELERYTVQISEASGKMYVLEQNTKSSVNAVNAVGASIRNILGQVGKYASMYIGIEELFQAFRNGVEDVRAVDTALTELKKVTDASESTYDQFVSDASKIGIGIGSTAAEFTEATAEFARLGHDISDSTVLAQAASVYKNVGDGIDDITAATDSIIATMAAYEILPQDAMSIVDAFNEVGNKFSTSSTGIGEALTRSASALAEGGNSLSESIALIVAANETVRDTTKVGKKLPSGTAMYRYVNGYIG